jgi:hypothetical protein
MNTMHHVKSLQQIISNIYAATEQMTDEEYGCIQDQLRGAIELIDAAQFRLIDHAEDMKEACFAPMFN